MSQFSGGISVPNISAVPFSSLRRRELLKLTSILSSLSFSSFTCFIAGELPEAAGGPEGVPPYAIIDFMFQQCFCLLMQLPSIILNNVNKLSISILITGTSRVFYRKKMMCSVIVIEWKLFANFIGFIDYSILYSESRTITKPCVSCFLLTKLNYASTNSVRSHSIS